MPSEYFTVHWFDSIPMTALFSFMNSRLIFLLSLFTIGGLLFQMLRIQGTSRRPRSFRPYRGIIISNKSYINRKWARRSVSVPYRGIIISNCGVRMPKRTHRQVSVPYRGIIISNPLPRIPLFKPAVVVICVGKLFLYIF